MKTTKIIRSITVAGAVAAALSLSACDMNISFGPPEQEQTQAQEGDETSANPDEQQEAVTPVEEVPEESESNAVTGDSPDSSSSQGSSSSSGTSTSAGEGSSSSSGEQASADDPGFEIDEHGNGTIPASLLEKDIEKAYSEQGTTVDEVECLNDLMVISKQGSASCNVTAYGEKRYGTVKVTSVSGNYVGYKLDFPSFN
ncbi:hypothetical protein [Brevibacterium sp. UCMA 11754]|uniref:hypothetical protein n=1 Tax=Brevibacterium sp. UCMA 11754 TaxID=2749198 RepID=UPI001F35B5B7|nr:hypothetical protein [Brevibacterium sp. UCMA 11754]MCF2571681.1 hypothetical protein [Brevibacterium sp. UCMA 11754]